MQTSPFNLYRYTLLYTGIPPFYLHLWPPTVLEDAGEGDDRIGATPLDGSILPLIQVVAMLPGTRPLPLTRPGAVKIITKSINL